MSGWKEVNTKMETKYVKVVAHTDDFVELSFTKNRNFTTDHGKTVPLNIDKRFIVRRGVPGLYVYGVFEREEDFPDALMYQLRIVFKLNADKFGFMAISDTRRGIMPRGEDRDSTRSQILAFKEAVLLTNPSNPQLKGEVDDKYQYSCENKDNKLHGWISDDDAVGFWIITPSNEFRTGGPNKQDLTSHVGPIALSMFVSTHYTGIDIDVTYKKGEAWRKVFGPVLIYLNSASSDDDYHNTLWNDAKRQARSAFVGLAAPRNAGSWQTEGKINGLMDYIEDGFIGDYKLDLNITIQPGRFKKSDVNLSNTDENRWLIRFCYVRLYPIRSTCRLMD
ncbi:Cinnamyl alcohol dehydrogenase 6 [Hibiscus syriacus]|uniref:Cinnamyl alcohol dehydrogenase 6 n=1 Tax=Hibiscus syriacus TaxID=106335 RepID=A0A6A2YIU3_HIBSY|nr:Cinnamyl alcohol dehydrogenase 6 [Hibiscus syriacus]